MLLPLEVTTETVRAKDLQCAEEDEQGEPRYEVSYAWNLSVVAQTLVVFVDEFSTELERILCACLPEERSNIIVERPLASSLEVYEVWIAVFVDHDVASLEVTIQERLHRLGS